MSKKECLEKDNNLTTPPRQDENPSVVTSKSSERRIAANRRNSALSTGPRTAKGKRASSRNAITHAILARGVKRARKNLRNSGEIYIECTSHKTA